MRNYEQELVQDTRKRTKKRNESKLKAGVDYEIYEPLDVWTALAMGAGVVILIALLWYLGFIVDTLISLIELG